MNDKELKEKAEELQDLLESAYAAWSDDGESNLVKMFYHGKADAYESSLSLINVALVGDPDEEEKS